MSSCTESLLIPLDLAKAPVNKEKPEKVIINPPAIFNEFKVMSKNIKINLPAKKEIINITKTLKEAQKAILFLSSVVCSCVKPTKMGTVPKGFITEINAPQMTKNKSILMPNYFSSKTAKTKYKASPIIKINIPQIYNFHKIITRTHFLFKRFDQPIVHSDGFLADHQTITFGYLSYLYK